MILINWQSVCIVTYQKLIQNAYLLAHEVDEYVIMLNGSGVEMTQAFLLCVSYLELNKSNDLPVISLINCKGKQLVI